MKRTFDIVFATAGLVITLGPLCLIASLVKATSRGPVLFMQKRVGRHGKVFKCIKFRTMYPNSFRYGTITTACDSRITPLGRILRRYKLDELPQLWNIIKGDMSFVGPRPDVPGYADRLEGDDRRILDLYPGITGPATLRFRDEEVLLSRAAEPQRYNDEVVFPEKVRINLAYLENWSILKDLGYILLTVAPGIGRCFGISKRLDYSPKRGP